MVTVPLGLSAYNRRYAGEPEIRLVNRFMETAPTNLREHVALIARAGSTVLAFGTAGLVRGNFSKVGLFGGDLFVAIGTQLYRVSATETIPITGTLANNNSYVYATWMKGIGYEFLFISDGSTLQYYTTHAMGTLTLAGGSITDFASGGQVIDINGTYYAWSASVNTGTPAGTSGSPYLAKLGSSTPDALGLTNDASSLSNMALLLNFSGISGSDYSAMLPGPSADVTATGPSDNLVAKVLVLTAIVDLAAGNAITTSIFSGTHLTWSAITLTGGGGQTLQLVTGMGAAEVPGSITNLSSNVLVAVGATQKFYWIEPGKIVIDPLNFASKESNPDNISQMNTVGDQAIICGDGSTENWYATGNFNAPFAPVEGRVYSRGALAGSAVVVKDELVLVGDDGVVYAIGYTWGGTAQYGVNRISTHGIEERIRTAIRANQGFPP